MIGSLSSAALLVAPQPTLATEETSSPFTVELQMQLDQDTVGTIEIEVHPEWAPLAAERFKELVTSGFYNDARVFRVLPNYVAQFGIASDPALNKEWIFCEKLCRALPDEPRVVPNADKVNGAAEMLLQSTSEGSRRTYPPATHALVARLLVV